MTLSARLLGLVLAGVLTNGAAKPAPWFAWRSKATGELACSQTPLGPGWERCAGPYRDSRCEKPIFVK